MKARQNNIYEFLTMDDLGKMKKTEVIQVNSNRVYSKIAEMSRKNSLDDAEKRIFAILLEKSDKRHKNDFLYVSMTVGEAKCCFESSPYLRIKNTFRKQESSIVKLMEVY